MPDITTKTFSDLENEGAVAGDLSPTATFLIKQGGQSLLIKGSTLMSLFAPTPPPVTTESPFVLAASGGGSVTIPANKMIVAVSVNPTANGTLRIGTVSGGSQVLEYEYLLSDGKQTVNVNIDFETDTIIYIAPTTATVRIFFI